MIPMKDIIKYSVKPKNKPVRLRNCPVGLFIFINKSGNKILCHANNYNKYYIVDSGEVFWGGTHRAEDRESLMVYPCKIKVKESPDANNILTKTKS